MEVKYFMLLLSVVAICVTAYGAVHRFGEVEIAKEAAKAGLVQQVVKVSYQPPIVIWVKSPAPALVEGADK